MAQSTQSANAVARTASKALGRTVTAKQVRGIARTSIARFDKVKHPEYQAHAYTASEASDIVAIMRKRAGQTTAPTRKPRASHKVAAATVASDA